MSQQKQRHFKRMSREDFVISRIRAIAEKPAVEAVEDHFAGMWNELGITLTVHSQTSDRDVIVLRNEILETLNTISKESQLPFTWITIFKRDGDTIELLFPGDELRNVDDTLAAS